MTIKLVALVLLCLITGTAVAQEPKVTSLISKDLPENPGMEALMITVEHAPGGSSAIHRHNAHASVYVLEGVVVAVGVPGASTHASRCDCFCGYRDICFARHIYGARSITFSETKIS